MKNLVLLGMAFFCMFGGLAACGDESSGTGGSGGATASSSSSGAGGEMAAGGGGGGTAGGGGGGIVVNGCNSATAEDRTAEASVKVTFGVNGNTYSPACIRVKAGTPVTFEGTFSTHPLVGGTTGAPPMPDSASPVKQTNSGTSATFTIEPKGVYPYYCEYHQPSMQGAIFAE